jgi:hypothetical protein
MKLNGSVLPLALFLAVLGGCKPKAGPSIGPVLASTKNLCSDDGKVWWPAVGKVVKVSRDGGPVEDEITWTCWAADKHLGAHIGPIPRDVGPSPPQFKPQSLTVPMQITGTAHEQVTPDTSHSCTWTDTGAGTTAFWGEHFMLLTTIK